MVFPFVLEGFPRKNSSVIAASCYYPFNFTQRNGRKIPVTTTKIVYGVTIYGVTFKIMTPYDLKFIKVTHHIKIFN